MPYADRTWAYKTCETAVRIAREKMGAAVVRGRSAVTMGDGPQDDVMECARRVGEVIECLHEWIMVERQEQQAQSAAADRAGGIPPPMTELSVARREGMAELLDSHAEWMRGVATSRRGARDFQLEEERLQAEARRPPPQVSEPVTEASILDLVAAKRRSSQ